MGRDDRAFVEGAAFAAAELGEGFGEGARRAVGAAGGHHGKRIGDAEDPRAERWWRERGIVGAVGVAVVLEDRVGDFGRGAQDAAELGAIGGVTVQAGAFVRRERAGFAEDGLGDADLAQVVEEAGEAGALDLEGREAHEVGEARGGAADMLAVDDDVFELRSAQGGAEVAEEAPAALFESEAGDGRDPSGRGEHGLGVRVFDLSGFVAHLGSLSSAGRMQQVRPAPADA